MAVLHATPPSGDVACPCPDGATDASAPAMGVEGGRSGGGSAQIQLAAPQDFRRHTPFQWSAPRFQLIPRFPPGAVPLTGPGPRARALPWSPPPGPVRRPPVGPAPSAGPVVVDGRQVTDPRRAPKLASDALASAVNAMLGSRAELRRREAAVMDAINRADLGTDR